MHPCGGEGAFEPPEGWGGVQGAGGGGWKKGLKRQSPYIIKTVRSLEDGSEIALQSGPAATSAQRFSHDTHLKTISASRGSFRGTRRGGAAGPPSRAPPRPFRAA